MKTIGILGGMSWESTAHYYRRINDGVKQRLGGLHSARIALVSVDFATIEPLQAAGEWDRAGELLAADAVRVQSAGADLLLLATNTMHRCAGAIERVIEIPLLHLADATAEALIARGHGRAGLLGTRYTMEQAFYRERLEAHGLDVLVPPAADRSELDRIIFDELCLGKLDERSRATLVRLMRDLQAAGADAVIAGCTEITMRVGASDSALPLFDTTAIHADAAIAAALADRAS